jgi:tartrate dehydratase beta subunit/fumarate hydratase class I family protein
VLDCVVIARDKAHRRIFARKVSEISTTPAAVSGHVLMVALQVEQVGSIARYFPRLPPPNCYPYG